jgi:hypothetical protein
MRWLGFNLVAGEKRNLLKGYPFRFGGIVVPLGTKALK